jgi:hypothetical protein
LHHANRIDIEKSLVLSVARNGRPRFCHSDGERGIFRVTAAYADPST